MGLRIGEGERRSPGGSEQHPVCHLQVTPEIFDIVDEMPGRILGEVGAHVRRIRQASAAVALVEEDDAINGGVEVARCRWCGT